MINLKHKLIKFLVHVFSTSKFVKTVILKVTTAFKEMLMEVNLNSLSLSLSLSHTHTHTHIYIYIHIYTERTSTL